MGTSGHLVVQLATPTPEENLYGVTRVNWDAYPSGVGAHLLAFHNTQEKAEALLKGEIRSIDEEEVEFYDNVRPNYVKYFFKQEDALRYADESYNYFFSSTEGWQLIKSNRQLVPIPKKP